MGRKQVIINPKSGERLSEWLRETHITQAALADLIGYTQQHISHVITGKKRMTRDFAILVSEKAVKPYPEQDEFDSFRAELNRIRPEYLLGEDDCKTGVDAVIAKIEKARNEKSACQVLLESSIREVCLREGVPAPEITITDLPKLLFLEAQLQDFSDSLAWNYVNGNEKSHVWGQLEKYGVFSDSNKKEE